VTDRLAAGPFPRGTVEQIAGGGVRHFVDLTGLGASYEAILAEECSRAAFPIADFSTPSREQMIDILDHIDVHLDEGVYVHCGAGIGRTGTVIGCWLIRHGLATGGDWQQVLAELRPPGAPSSPETAAQRAFVTSWKPGT
jgi:hypothetical protein